MNSILDAIQAAQQRNMMRDQMNAIPAPVMQNPMLVFPSPSQSGGGEGPDVPDTRTPAEKYLQAVNFNQAGWSDLIPGSSVMKLANDYYISQFEKENPHAAFSGSRYSTLGSLLGFGDGTQQARSGGILGRLFGGPSAQRSSGWESGGGGDGPAAAQGTSNFGGRESSVGMDDRSGYA